MYPKIILFFVGFVYVSGVSFSQTKKDLLIQVEQKNKTIDSLIKIMDNNANTLENRDRTIKYLREDVVVLKDDIKALNTKISGKNRELVSLRKQASSGLSKLKGIRNSSSLIKVPEGKYWIINQFISDYVSGMTPDSTGALQGEEIHVFIKTINNATLTDPSKNIFGPQVYSSMNPNHTLQFPLVLTENTSVTFILLKGSIGSYTKYDGKVYCTITERDN